MKKITLLLSLLLFMPPARGDEPLRVPNACGAGKAFTIVVPVQLPAGVQVSYRWYRNGVAIAGAVGNITPSNTTVAYTIPANNAYGNSVEFYFDYRAHGSAAYNLSPVYVVSFNAAEGSEPPVCSGTLAGIVGTTCSTTSGAIGNTCGTASGTIGSTCGTAPGAIGS